jgi:hypothetical protein
MGDEFDWFIIDNNDNAHSEPITRYKERDVPLNVLKNELAFHEPTFRTSIIKKVVFHYGISHQVNNFSSIII